MDHFKNFNLYALMSVRAVYGGLGQCLIFFLLEQIDDAVLEFSPEILYPFAVTYTFPMDNLFAGLGLGFGLLRFGLAQIVRDFHAVEIFLEFLAVMLVIAIPFQDKPYTGGIGRFCQLFDMACREMFRGEADAGVQPRYVFGELDEMTKLRTAACHDDSAVEHAVVETYLFEMIGDEIHDLAHPGLNDVGQVLDADLFGRHAAQTGDRNIRVGFCFVCQGRSELYLHLFRLRAQYAQPGLDIVRYILAAERDHRGMFEYPFVEYGQIGGPAADVHDGYAGFQVFLSHDGCCRGQRLEDQVLGEEVTFLHGAVDIPDGVLIAGYDMKVRPHLNAAVADGIGDV